MARFFCAFLNCSRNPPGQTALPAFYTLSKIAADPLTASSFAFNTTDYKKVINQADQTFARTINWIRPDTASALYGQLDLRHPT